MDIISRNKAGLVLDSRKKDDELNLLLRKELTKNNIEKWIDTAHQYVYNNFQEEIVSANFRKELEEIAQL